MTNRYLEKIASTALMRNLAKGAISGITGLARDGSKMGAAALNKSVAGATKSYINAAPATKVLATGGKRTLGFVPRPNKIVPIANPARSTMTTDVLGQNNLAQRLATRKAEQAAGKVAGPKVESVFKGQVKAMPASPAAPAVAAPKQDLLGRAKSFVKAKPLTSLGLGVASAGTVAYNLGKAQSGY